MVFLRKLVLNPLRYDGPFAHSFLDMPRLARIQALWLAIPTAPSGPIYQGSASH